MSSPSFARATALMTVIATSSAAFGATGDIFADSFESGARATSTDGFVWSRTGDSVFVSDQVARTGTHSLCFLYKGKPSGMDSTAEQRFKLGSENTELWLQFFVRFPANYRHRSDSPSNNKFLMLWSRDYKDPGITAGMHLWADGNGNSNLSYTVGLLSPHFPSIEDGGHPRMVSVDTDLEKWIEVTYHWKRQSAETASDGVVEIWRRVGDGPREKIISATDLNRNWSSDGGSNPGYNFIDQGYLMGWSNSGFDQDTTICIDDVRFSAKPLISVIEPGRVTGVIVN